MQTTRRYALFSILWILVIFSFSLQDGSASSLTSGFLTQNLRNLLAFINIHVAHSDLSFFVRKSAHFVEYFILALLTLKSGQIYKSFSWFTLALLMPWLDEGLQLLVPGRSGSLSDVFIDTLGLLCAYGLWLWIRKKSP